MNYSRFLILVLLAGCASLPVSNRTLQNYKLEQADADAEQSHQIASVAQATAKVASVVVAIAPVEQKNVAGLVLGQVDANAAMAQTMADAHSAYAAEQAEAKVRMDAEPGIADAMGSAMTGDWGTLMDLGLMALSTYLVGDKVRTTSRTKRIKKKGAAMAKMSPEDADKMMENDPDFADVRKEA